MTLGGVARVAMEYRQHLQMLNNISKLTMAVDTKTTKLGSTNGDTLSCEFSYHSNASTSHFSFSIILHSFFLLLPLSSLYNCLNSIF